MPKHVFGAGQQGSLFIPVTAGITLLGAGVYYSTKKNPEVSDEEARRSRGQAKKNEGLGGAGIGGNAVTGGHELSHANSDRKEGTTAPPEKLPSGGVGGGVGAGGANVRAIEMSAKERPGTSSTTSGSGILGSLFGTGGSKSGSSTDQETKDTRVASNYDGTPTKKDATHHDQHQPRVPKSGGGGSGSKGDDQGSGKSSGQSVSQSLQGMLHGGSKAEPGEQSSGFRDTKVASNHTETATKRS
ncbi:hypothetical protein FZEAL_5924 [Fusarium zealandicum]|uniref:Uncharacterized protein n=1 Tax=Fusarium zealandicum TaxID=1053134 RepID=A0A8H4UIN6_9HYPO|nr:hypothetical protein FZEAL_5924 [Fusarium zealandicum]